jgi:AmpD protein
MMSYRIDADGWCAGAQAILSPNCDARPPGSAVDLLVVHNISLPPGQFGNACITELFTNALDCDAHPYFERLRALKVSAHFLIRREGDLLQFVPTVARAWHAGASRFEGRERCNDFSIGVELEGCDDKPFEAVQYAVLAELTRALHTRHPIAAVAGHEHIAPGRKTDPGPCFDWALYRKCLIQNDAALRSENTLRFPS